MDPGMPAMRQVPLQPGLVADQAPYLKSIWQRSATRTCLATLGTLALAGLRGDMAWRDVGAAAAIAVITAGLALYLGEESVGLRR